MFHISIGMVVNNGLILIDFKAGLLEAKLISYELFEYFFGLQSCLTADYKHYSKILPKILPNVKYMYLFYWNLLVIGMKKEFYKG